MTPRLIVFDWAGTLVDHGCRAPLIALLQAFEAEDLPIDEATARAPMGAHKREHVRTILALPALGRRLPLALRALDDEARVERLYRAFAERLQAVLPAHAAPIDGVPAALCALRERGIALGSCSGYTRAMMDAIEPAARAAGLDPGPVVCADEVPEARPAPWACFRLAERAGVWPLADALKVGDTPADIAEGRSAGMRCVGITATGNEVGLDAAALAALPAPERARRLGVAAARLAGADALLESAALLPAWLPPPAR
jgi:phosphonoacetaldehyde hydrolase